MISLGTIGLPPGALLNGLEQSKEGFALTDAEGLFTYMNRQHLTMFGFNDLSEVLGRSWRILYEDAVADMMVAEVMPLLMRDGSWSGHVMARRRDGRTFHKDLTLSLRPDGGIVCNCRDRTKEIEMAEMRRTLERQAERLTMQREFTALVSHEFSTPMATISGAIYMLRNLLKAEPNPKVTRYLDLQEEALGNLIDVIRQVRELNQIEEETGELTRNPVELPALVSSALKTFPETVVSGRVVVELPPPAAGVPLVMGNEGLLRSALSNLVSNGLKYSEKPIRVSVFAENGGWCLQVRDEGRGVPEQDQKRLFEPFFRAGNVGNISGAGLGLRIARRTMELHGGCVTFTSAEGAGSTFSLHLPIPAKPPAPAVHP